MVAFPSSVSRSATALALLGAGKSEAIPASRADSTSRVLAFSFDMRAQTISFMPGTDSRYGLSAGLDAVKDAWAAADRNSRRTDDNGRSVIDGDAFGDLEAAILGNRDKFPPGAFTLRMEWKDGASIETTIPATQSVRVQSVSISAVFAQSASNGQSSSFFAASFQSSYQEWQ